MLAVALYLAAVGVLVAARTFNVTELIVPEVVPPGQQQVDIECKYDANFTLLSWFKGANEFFRYRPGAAPSTRSFPILGVGTVDIHACGPTACSLRLGALTEEATGLYRCDLERDVPPYKFATRTAYMVVHGHEPRRPLVEGLAEEYAEGDILQAYCRGAPNSEILWYVNSQEIKDMRGSATLKWKATRTIYMGLLPTITVQCAELRYGKLYGSKDAKTKWSKVTQIRKDDLKEAKNSSCGNLVHLGLLSIVLYLLNGM